MSLRDNNLHLLEQDLFDVLVIGGGINGAVAAAALSAKGAKVALIDKEDFAGFTSANSSNLAWGGIKYLESHEYRLVNKLCKSRNLLMQSYPSTIKEIRFLACVHKGFRYKPFFIYLGALLYWAFGRFYTRPPHYCNLQEVKRREHRVDTRDTAGGVEYSDAYFTDNDSRFVFGFIRASLKSGCTAANYVMSSGADFSDGVWLTDAKDVIANKKLLIKSKVLINATGPFVDKHNEMTKETTLHHHLFSKGVHLVVDRLIESRRVLAFFASDGRLFFIIPMASKTCIGTTDTPVSSPESEVTEDDRQFILDNVNQFLDLAVPLTTADIISERCGVRPLAVTNEHVCADWMKLSRKHAIDVNSQRRHISIFGGKLTDCINVGEEVSSAVAKFGIKLRYPQKIWYGEPKEHVKYEFFRQADDMALDRLTHEHAPESLSLRLWRRYGDDAFTMLSAIRQDRAQARTFFGSTGYLRCEVEYAAKHEMVVKLDDFLRRRTQLSQTLGKDTLSASDDLQIVCQILFGDNAEEKLREYLLS